MDPATLIEVFYCGGGKYNVTTKYLHTGRVKIIEYLEIV